MLVRAIRLAENLVILSLLTGSAMAMHVAIARERQRPRTAPPLPAHAALE